MPIGRCRLRTQRRLHSGHRRLHSAQRPQRTAPAGFTSRFAARLPSGTATDTRAPRRGRAGAALRGRFSRCSPAALPCAALSRFDARRDSLRCCHCALCACAGAGFDSRGRPRPRAANIYMWRGCGVRFSLLSCCVVLCCMLSYPHPAIASPPCSELPSDRPLSGALCCAWPAPLLLPLLPTLAPPASLSAGMPRLAPRHTPRPAAQSPPLLSTSNPPPPRPPLFSPRKQPSSTAPSSA